MICAMNKRIRNVLNLLGPDRNLFRLRRRSESSTQARPVAGQVNQLVERMVVAEVNSAEPGVLASERSRFHRNGLVTKWKDPSRAGPSDPSQQVRWSPWRAPQAESRD
jgi:hypothetical protein